MATESAADLSAKKEKLATRISQDVGNSDGSTTGFIYSIEAPCVITNDDALGDRNMTVYADRIEIKGMIRRPGRKIALYAREIVGVDAGAGFDVSGPSVTATQNALPPAQPGSNGPDGHQDNKTVTPGINGTNGKDAGDTAAKGADAASAGSITIVAYRLGGNALHLQANGGNAEAGQAGQAAGHGGNGGNGTGGFVYGSGAGRGGVIWHHVNGSNGGAAGSGGKGGNGGAGGRGGNAGRIVCRYVEHESAPVLVATPGSGGKGGAAGAGGAAGTPGNGGSGHDGTSDGARGAAGTPGANGTPGADGATGAAGTATATVATLADMWATVHPVQAGLLLQQARLGYISADPSIKGSFTAPAASLRWLFDITSPFSAAKPPQGSAFGASDVARLAAINTQAQALLTRMSHQRDAFGNSFAWTPCLSYDYCSKTLAALGVQFDAIGAALDQYITEHAEQAQRHDSATAGLGQARAKSTAIADRLTDIDASIKSSAEDIGPLMDDVEAARTALVNQLQHAKDAIEGKTKCTFDALLQGAGMVAMMDPESGMFAATLATQTASVANSVAEQNDYASFDTGQVNKHYIVRRIDTFGSDVKTLAEGYTLLSNSPQLKIDDPNCYKVKVATDKIDSALSPYTDLKDVQEAIADVDKFLAACQKLNDGLFQYNAFVMQKSELLGQKKQLDADVGDFETILARLADADDAGLMAMMMRNYHQMRDECISMLYMTSRTYAYWAVKRPDIRGLLPSSGDIGPTDIHTAIGTVLDNTTAAHTEFGNIDQPFDSPDGLNPNPITIDDKDVLAAFAKPDKTGSYTLFHALPIPKPGDTSDKNQFFGMRNVRIREIQVYLDGATSTRDLNITVTHGGREEISNAAGDRLTFESTPIDTQFSYNPGTMAISRRSTYAATDRDIYAPVGPFCTWTFKVDAALNGKVDLSKLKAVRLVFFGYSL